MNPTLEWLQAAEKEIHGIVMELRPKLLDAQVQVHERLKDDKTIVTDLDFLVENTLRTRLAAFDKGVGFCGEETGADYSQQTYWLVDPIDGTQSFVRRLPFATNMIALIDQGEALLSVIYNFAADEYYMATKGQGATCNGEPIHVSARTMEQSAFVMSRSALATIPFRRFYELDAGGYELALVARGAIDGRVTVRGRGKPWDYAPGALLVAEAGGRVANIGKETYDFLEPNFLATNPAVFDEMQAHATKLLHEIESAGQN